MPTTPLPSPIHLIQNVHHLPAGSKVRVLGCIRSYESVTGIMTLHHRPSIDIPLPQLYSGRSRERKRPGPVGDENASSSQLNGVRSGTSIPSRRLLPLPKTTARKVSVGNSSVSGRSVNVSSAPTRTTVPGRMGNGHGSTMSRGNPPHASTTSTEKGASLRAVNGASPISGNRPPITGRNPVPPASVIKPLRAVNGASPISGNRPPTAGRNPVPPASVIKPLLTASQKAVSALESMGMRNKRPPPPAPPPLRRPNPLAITIPPTDKPASPLLTAPVPPPPPPKPPNYTLRVSVDLTLQSITSELHTSLPPIVEGIWVNVIGYKRRDGVIDAIAIFKVKGKLDLEAYEKAIVGMARVRETVEWEVKEGIAKGKGLTGWNWD